MLSHKVSSVLVCSLVALSLSAAGCDDGASSAAPSAQAAAPASWKLDAMPQDAVGVAQAKTTATDGQTITVTGRIGGRAEPITAESGLFVIMDQSVPSCAEMEEDHCPMPWDYCCEPAESITANAATVQLRDAEGNPVALHEGDLSPLNLVAVTGTVAPRHNGDTLVVYATGVHVIAEQ